MQDRIDQMPNKNQSFILNSITFKGYTAFTEEELMNIICDKVGTRVTVGDLVGMTNAVTEFYQFSTEQEYFLHDPLSCLWQSPLS